MDAYDLLQIDIKKLPKKWTHKTNEEMLDVIFTKRDELFTLIENNYKQEMIDKDCSAASIYNNKPLNEFESEIIKLGRGYERSKQMFIEKNILMITHQINKYNFCRDTFLNLFQEATIYFQKSFNTYDCNHENEASFESFAFNYIRFGAINHLKEMNNIIKLNDNVRNVVNKIQKSGYLDGAISLNELYSLLEEHSETEINNAIIYSDKSNMLHIDKMVYDEGKPSDLHDKFLEDDYNVEDIVQDSTLNKLVNRIIEHRSFTERDKCVLRMRFGIDLVDSYTLEEIAQQFDLTRERIRQIETKLLDKIKIVYGEELKRAAY